MSSMSKKMVNGAVALGCLLFAAPVMAHEALNEYVLDPIMVTAARYEKRDVDIPAATEIYDQQKIEKLGANNVMEVVKNIPGFTLTASPTGNTYIGFRGISKGSEEHTSELHSRIRISYAVFCLKKKKKKEDGPG
mgnify:CR=1 FL=1